MHQCDVGAKILSGDYAFAARRYRGGQVALRHAVGMYNTGRLNAGAPYIRAWSPPLKFVTATLRAPRRREARRDPFTSSRARGDQAARSTRDPSSTSNTGALADSLSSVPHVVVF